MPSRFAAVTNKEISQLIKQAVPEIHEESDEVWFGSLNGKALSFWLEFIDKTGENVFCLQMQIKETRRRILTFLLQLETVETLLMEYLWPNKSTFFITNSSTFPPGLCHFGANYLGPCHLCHRVRVASRAVKKHVKTNE